MDFTHFMRIERVVDGQTRHYVVHMRDPRFSIELTPDAEAADKMGAGVIKRICVPNSCIGNYQQYAAFIAAAQAFFRESLAGEATASPRGLLE
jgi:hypothetical protein